MSMTSTGPGVTVARSSTWESAQSQNTPVTSFVSDLNSMNTGTRRDWSRCYLKWRDTRSEVLRVVSVASRRIEAGTVRCCEGVRAGRERFSSTWVSGAVSASRIRCSRGPASQPNDGLDGCGTPRALRLPGTICQPPDQAPRVEPARRNAVGSCRI